MSGEQIAPVVEAGVQAIRDNAERLGLKWQLRIGTVKTGDLVRPTVQLDGDTSTIQPVSMIGHMNEDNRVYVMSTDDGANFAIGRINPSQIGSVLISFVTLASTTVNVDFDEPFLTVPNVHTNINSGSGTTSNWHSRAINITRKTFQIFVFGAAASTWVNVEVLWSAFAK
jgi:hypothetical protein